MYSYLIYIHTHVFIFNIYTHTFFRSYFYFRKIKYFIKKKTISGLFIRR